MHVPFKGARYNRLSVIFLSRSEAKRQEAPTSLTTDSGAHTLSSRAIPRSCRASPTSSNVDGAGWSSELGYLYGSLDASAFHRDLLADLGLSPRVTLKPGVTDWVDAWTLSALGGAASGYLLWFESHSTDGGPDTFSPYHHTQHDRVGARDYDNLSHDLRFAALSLFRVDAAEALPFDLEPVGRWILDELAEVESASVLAEERAEVEHWARRLVATKPAGPEARLANLRLLRARSELVPWLLSLSSSGAVLRSSPYLSDFLALRRAREHAEAGDSEGAREALLEVSTMGWGSTLSPSAYRAERLMGYGRFDWSEELGQNPKPVAHDIQRLFIELGGDPIPDGVVERLRELEIEALAGCREALFVMAGKLEKAVSVLAGESTLGAPPIGTRKR